MRKKAFYILLITSFSTMLGISIISPFLPRFAEQHGANGFWLGMIFAGFGISRGLVVPFVGRISDRTGRKIFVVSGILLYTVLSVFYPYARGVISLTVLRLFHGLASGMIIPVVLAYVGDVAKKGKESVTVSMVNTMFYIGLAMGPLTGGIVDQYYGFNAVFHTITILGVLNFFVVIFVLPDSKSPAKEIAGSLGGFREIITYNLIKIVLITAVLITLMLVVFISFVPSLAEQIHINTVHIGFLLFIGIFLTGILQVPFGKIADKRDRIGKLFQISTGVSVGMFALLAMPFCPDFTALVIAGIFLGIGTAVAVPAMAGISVAIGKKTGMGTWMGIINGTQSLAFVITPLVFGITMDYLGIDAVFYLIVLICFIFLTIFFHYLCKK